MGCCGSQYKYELEDYFKICIGYLKINKLTPEEAFSIIFEKDNTNTDSSKDNKIINTDSSENHLKTNSNNEVKETKLHKEVLNKLSTSLTKTKYQEIVKSFFIDNSLNETTKSSQIKLQSSHKNNNFPTIEIFNKLLLDKLYESNKAMLLIRLFSLLRHSSNKSSDYSTKMFYKLLEKIYGVNKINYSHVKAALNEYITINLVNPYDVVFLKTESEERKSEIKFILENDFSEIQRLDFLNSVLRNYELLKLKSIHEDDFAKDLSLVKYEDFKLLIDDSNLWSWEIFELREIYMLKYSSLTHKR